MLRLNRRYGLDTGHHIISQWDGPRQPLTGIDSYQSTVGEALQKFFSKPKLNVSLEKVITSEHVRDVKNQYLPFTALLDEAVFADRTPYRLQGLTVTAHRAEIHHCKAKLTVDGQEAGHLVWETVEPNKHKMDTTRHLLPEEHELLVIWRATKRDDGETFDFNTADKFPFDLQKFNKPVPFEITFFYEGGLLKKKPYRYRMTLTPWDKIAAQEVGG